MITVSAANHDDLVLHENLAIWMRSSIHQTFCFASSFAFSRCSWVLCHGNIDVSWCCVCNYLFYFILVRTACLVLITFYLTCFKGAYLSSMINSENKCYLLLAKRPVMLLNTVISEILLWKEACLSCLSIHWLMGNSAEGRTTTPTQNKVAQTTSLTACHVFLMLTFCWQVTVFNDMSGYSS